MPDSGIRGAVRVMDADVEGPLPWSASEYIPAPALDEVVTNYGPLPVDSVWEPARGMAEALQAPCPYRRAAVAVPGYEKSRARRSRRARPVVAS
ncbi:hypothetical protein ABZ412_10355 [Nocardia sp. NPDC005746]|uniref:hypothetical protein n=1 Tax=Nocardia sp. NPDC005746 TaxID=3157062 RepID=UPI0033D3961D